MAKILNKEAPPFPFTKPNPDTYTINAEDIGYIETTIQPAEDEEEEGQQELITVDHSSDTQHSTKSFWQKDGSSVTMNTNDSISDKTIRALEEPIELLQGQTITITTAVHGLACNLFLVTDAEGNYLYKQAPAAAKTAETHVYVATEDCFVYVNTLTTKTFSCVVTYLTEGGSTPEPISELVTVDHTNDAFSETKAAWKLDDYNHITSIDSPSDNTTRKIIAPISLLAGQKLKLTTATYSTTINMYIVTDANGNKIAKKTPAAAKTAEYSEYTAENDCLVYINKLTTKDFSCVVEYTTEVTPDTPSSDTERPVIVVEEEIGLDEKLRRVTQHIETLNGKMANLAETPSVESHDDDAFVNSASVWVIDGGHISHNDSPSNSNARRIETAIPLTAEQQIVITTGAWGTAINAYIVTDSTGKVIAHKTVTANTGVQEYKYTAESNCLVYINKMTTRDFACSVNTSGGRLATIEANVESVATASEAHSKSIASLEENVESINAALNNIVDQITTVADHTNDAFDTEASAWKIESGQIATIDSPSNPNTRKIITPIHLGIGKKITLTTACYGTAINAYIVTDDEGNVIAHETVAAASVVETFHYTALSDCYVYVNKVVNKDFSCVVQAVDYHAPENPDDLPTPEETDTGAFGDAVVELNVTKDYYLKGKCEQTFKSAYKKDTYTRYKIFALKGDYIKVKREATTSGYQCIVNLQFKDGFTTKTTLPVTTKTFNPCNATEEFVFAEMWDDVVELYIYHGSTTTAGTETITVTTYRQSDRMAEGSYQFGINANGFYHVQEDIPALSEAMNLTNHEERLLSSWYDLYDGLVSAYKNYVSKVDCDDIMVKAGVERPQALASEDKSIYMYKFIPASVNKATAGTSATTMDKIPNHDRLKVLICTGTHPEYISMWDCYQMMRLICEKWKTDDNLSAMRWDVEFYIIPCAGPSGITSGARTNANGVDLNRNMPTWNWKVQGAMGDNTYSGASANSEYESQLLCKMIDDIKPNIFIDHHNYASTTSKMLIYVTAGKAMGWDAGAAHINLMSRKWQQEYSDVFPDNSVDNSSDLMFGFAQRCEAIGARVTYASQRGILAFTYESSASVNYANGVYSQGQPNYNALACTVATEGFLNFVLRICKTYSDNLSPKTFIM